MNKIFNEIKFLYYQSKILYNFIHIRDLMENFYSQHGYEMDIEYSFYSHRPKRGLYRGKRLFSIFGFLNAINYINKTKKIQEKLKNDLAGRLKNV